MGSNPNESYRKKKIDKRFLSKNKSIKIYKEKYSKIETFKKEVAQLTEKYAQIDLQKVEKFDHFPLTGKTRKALKFNGYIKPTEIQKESIMLGLNGKDILGAAKTGSGKTLAFVIPILEQLYCSGWTILDGLGAIIITPTRELAYQIYEVINKVGAQHNFSVALVIGGKDLAKERKLLDKCNILICTPGRLLQHMDENPLFDAMNLKILVLDEADRILDLGFQKTMNAILENLPEERQTLLFSATQTKSVKDLARCSLKNPVYVSVHEHSKFTTPESLQQSYMVCEAHDKMNLIWSFIKNHKRQKILVFMASCKQVKYTYESMCRLRPGVSVMALYGSLHQLRRMEIYDEFCRKNHVVMFATDVASRGLDFPNVNWVVQLDCPEDVNTYIHRAGRTARFEHGGEAMLVLLPSEKSMIEQLANRKIPIEEIKANPNKLISVQRKLEAICARDVNLKDSGNRGYKAYLKNLFLMKDKTVFDVTKVNFELYARSLGLAFAPRIRFLEKHLKPFLEKISSDNKISLDDQHLLKIGNNSSDESDDDLLKPKETSNAHLESEEDFEDIVDQTNVTKKILTKAALAKRMIKKKIKPNTVIKFDEEGMPIREVCGKAVPIVAAELRKEIMEEGYSIEKAKLLKEKEDEVDKLLYKEKIRSKHREEKMKLKERKWQKNPAGAPATLDETEGDAENDVNTSENEIDPNNWSSSESEQDNDSENSEGMMKNRTNSSSSDDQSETKESPEKESQPKNFIRNKRKKNIQNLSSKKKKVYNDANAKQNVGTSRTIEDDEQLALHFLGNF